MRAAGLVVIVVVSAASAPAVEQPDWYRTDAAVERELDGRDLMDWSRELAGRLDEAGTTTLLTAINVFIRSGHPERVRPAVARLCQRELPQPLQCWLADEMIDRRLWSSARAVLDAFPKLRSSGLSGFVENWRRTGDLDELEAWLKAPGKTAFARRRRVNHRLARRGARVNTELARRRRGHRERLVRHPSVNSVTSVADLALSYLIRCAEAVESRLVLRSQVQSSRRPSFAEQCVEGRNAETPGSGRP